MKILAIDTACSACSVGVLTAEGVIAARSELMMRGHAESLMPMVRSVLADAECEFSDVSLIAVTVGPGSFTGIRTGLAAARGLGVALGVQVSGVTTLEAIAAATISSATVTGKPCILAAIETRRTDLYVQLFESEPGPGGVPRPVDAPKALRRWMRSPCCPTARYCSLATARTGYAKRRPRGFASGSNACQKSASPLYRRSLRSRRRASAIPCPRRPCTSTLRQCDGLGRLLRRQRHERRSDREYRLGRYRTGRGYSCTVFF